MNMPLRAVQFGEFNTADDWGLILHEKNITPPKAKTNYVSVPGRDGDLDLTEALSGVVNYQDRIGTFSFILADGKHDDRERLISEIVGALNGQRLRYIDLDDYPDHYMIGRFSVLDVMNINAYGTMTVEATFSPWRYSLRETTVRQSVSSDGEIPVIISNRGYKTVTPIVTVTGSVTLLFGSNSVTLTEGTYTVPGLLFAPGVTTIGAAGFGSVEMVFTEAIF